MKYAEEWRKPGGANIRRELRPDKNNTADTRIRFKSSQRWWSYMGKDCQYGGNDWNFQNKEGKEDNPERTSMNLDIENEAGGDVTKRHVFHEFSYALGFMHEHLRSDFPWKLDEKIAKEMYLK